jgi:hypothetical protein
LQKRAEGNGEERRRAVGERRRTARERKRKRERERERERESEVCSLMMSMVTMTHIIHACMSMVRSLIIIRPGIIKREINEERRNYGHLGRKRVVVLAEKLQVVASALFLFASHEDGHVSRSSAPIDRSMCNSAQSFAFFRIRWNVLAARRLSAEERCGRSWNKTPI